MEQPEGNHAAIPAAMVAVLFVRAEAMPVGDLAQCLGITGSELKAAMEAAAQLLDGTGLMLQNHLGEVQLVSHPKVAWAVERALRPEVAGRLSRAALETLAIVAYRQPITRTAIEGIRGVNCEAVLESLTRHGLVSEVARDDGPGRARLFGTTLRFLQVVGIASTEDLPPVDWTQGEGWLGRAAELAGGDAD